MDTYAVPLALIKIAATFLLMLFVIRRQWPLWTAIAGGGLILSLLFGLSGPEIISVSLATFQQQSFISLFLVIFCIMALSEVQEATGQGKRLVSGLTPYIRSTRLRLAFFPALVGLLPMPGGAVFSCPMVKDVAEPLAMSESKKAVINYWFRHIWESAWPLYPGYILACSLADISPSILWRYTSPFVLATVFAGWFFLLRKPVTFQEDFVPSQEKKRSPGAVFMEALPIVTAIGGALAIDGLSSAFNIAIPSGRSFIFSFAAATGVAMAQNRVSPAALARLLFRPHVAKMLALVAAIFLFKELVFAAKVVGVLATAISGKGTILLLFFFLSILMGFLTGIMFGFVGAVFPLLMGLLVQTGAYDERLLYVLVALTAGHFGQMISPMHSCYLVTLEFFRVPLSRTWGAIIKTSVLYISLTLTYITLLYFISNPIL